MFQIVTDLRRQVEELKEQKTVSKPPEVLEEHRKTTSEAIKTIRQGGKLCTEDIEAISMMWEVLLEDETMEKIKEYAPQADLKITTVNAYMKNLLIKERITKVTELKQLQQEEKTLPDQDKKRNDEVTEHQSEVERVIGLIQPIQQKLQHITQSMEEGPSKQSSYDRVEQVANQAEEVTEEFSRVQQILKEFQDKVGPVAQLASET